MTHRFCKPNAKGRCRYCGASGRTSQDQCSPGEPQRHGEGKATRKPRKPKAKRTDEQRLEILTDHCSTCDQFKDAKHFSHLKCRRVGSCGCLWSKMESALFSCPLNPPLFGPDTDIIQAFAELEASKKDKGDRLQAT